MASISKANRNNFLRWNKITGGLTLADLQANGLPTGSTAWDIGNPVFVQEFNFTSQDAFSKGIHWKPDGTKLYMVGTQNDSVYEYDVSTAWDSSTASYSQLFDVSTQDTTPTDVRFNGDGDKMYIMGNATDRIYEYDSSTAWDVSTAVINQNLSITATDNNPQGLYFNTDGTKMFFSGGQNDTVYEYSLSSAWDISTASAVASFSVSSQTTLLSKVFFSTDLSKMFVSSISFSDITDNRIFEYNVSGDVSTAVYSQTFDPTTLVNYPTGMYFKPDGTRMFLCGDEGTTKLWEYEL